MKQRSTTPVSRGFAAKSIIVACAILMAAAVPVSLFSRNVQADQYDQQISALQRQADQYQAQANAKRQEADTLANKLAVLASQKAGVQAQIDLNQAKYEQLTAQIKATEVKIKNNQDALGTTIADMYVDDTISPLEMLASSKNIGDYVDKQTYRSVIQDQLNQTITNIKDLKTSLSKDQASVKDVLDKQTAQRNSLVAIEAEQQALLNKTKGEEAAYQQQVSDVKAQQEQAHSQQQAYYQRLLARSSNGGGGGVSSGVVGSFQYSNLTPGNGAGGCSGGYPYCGPQDTSTDPWALYNRECVSYVAWALQNKFGKSLAPFNGQGNAYQWPSSAPRFSGAVRVSTPQRGDAVILPADSNFAPIGHAMVVESVNGNSMHVSQFNFYGTGQYSEMDINNSGVIILRFPG